MVDPLVTSSSAGRCLEPGAGRHARVVHALLQHIPEVRRPGPLLGLDEIVRSDPQVERPEL